MGTTEKLNKGAKKSKVVFHCSVSPFLQINRIINFDEVFISKSFQF